MKTIVRSVDEYIVKYLHFF